MRGVQDMSGAPLADPRRWWILSAVSVGTFMATLNSSIVNISLPTIAREFGVGVSEVEWVVLAYLLATGTILLTFGRLGDVFGYKKFYLGGFALFIVSGAACGFAQNIVELVVLRVFQGIGAGAIQAIGPAIVTSSFDPSERGKALGINAVSVSFGLALGPTLGGIIAEVLSWRWIFFINLPIGLLGFPWAARTLRSGVRKEEQSFDPFGAVLIGGTLLPLLLAIVEGESWGWLSPPTLGLLAAAVVFGAAFAFFELRAEQPLFDLRLFAIRTFSAENFSLLTTFIALLTASFLMPFFLQRGQDLTALQAGFLITPLSLTTLFVSPLSGALSDRIGTRLLVTVGLACVVLGLLTLTRIGAGTGGWDIVWRLAVIGFGIGLFSSPNQSAVMGSVPPPRLGTASGTIAQMRITGQILGIAASGAILAARIPDHARALAGKVPGALLRRDALIFSIHDAFYFAAAICFVGVLASLVGGEKSSRAPK